MKDLEYFSILILLETFRFAFNNKIDELTNQIKEVG